MVQKQKNNLKVAPDTYKGFKDEKDISFNKRCPDHRTSSDEFEYR